MASGFAHIELSTDDVGKAKQFYKALFGWKLKDMPGQMPYTMIDTGVPPGGGMAGKQMPNQPTAWLPYVQVADVKKSLAKARSLGANVVVDFMSIGEFGAIGVLVDPTGAAIGVWEMAKGGARKAGAKKAGAKKAGAKKAGAKKAGARKPAKKAAAKKSRKK